MLEEILDRRNIERALESVEANKGSSGIDSMPWNMLRPYINANWQQLRKSILEECYKPKPVREVEINKTSGGKRKLGIPTVVDRMLTQAIAQWLMPKYEENFSDRSYGFRPNRNAHQAVLQAQSYLNEGKRWVIEFDLENFFDKVNHDRLMSILSRKVNDKRTLKLIRLYLTSGILAGGVTSTRSEGTPQGSPLASRTHQQTLSFRGGYRSEGVSFSIIIKSITFMKNGKSTECRVSETYQQCVHHASKRKASATYCGELDREVWNLTSAGVSLYPAGKGNQREDAGAGKFCGLYCKTTTDADQACKEAIEIKEVVDQQSGPYCAGRIFSKEGSCQKRTNKLRCLLAMTGCGSRSSRRFIISLFHPTMLFSLNKLLMN